MIGNVDWRERFADRHPATLGLLRWFEYDHLPPHLQAVSAPAGALAVEWVAELPDGPELTAGLRKLLEAKDCAVRQALDAVQSRSRTVGGGGPVDPGSGGEIGPQRGADGDSGPVEGEIVPAEGLAATHLTPEQVQGLVERSGPRGPADELTRRSGSVTFGTATTPEAVEALDRLERAGSGPIGPIPGAERVERGDCMVETFHTSTGLLGRCHLAAGHDGEHSAVGPW